MPPTNLMLSGIGAAAIATGKVLDPAAVWLGLFISGPSATPPTTVANFVLPDATDMPAEVLTTWESYHLLTDGRLAWDSALKTFRLPNADNAFTAAGWYLADALVSGNVLDYGTFGTPISLPNEHYSVSIIHRLTLDPLGRWSSQIVANG